MSSRKVIGCRATGLVVAAALAGCAAPAGSGGDAVRWPEVLTPATRVAVIEGFVTPESVKYDADQDVYFVGNFNVGGMTDRDNNGYITKLGPDGAVLERRWVEGGVNGVVLHAPKGMAIQGPTLWVVDAHALRGFDRRTGAPTANIDLSHLPAGLPNDVAEGPDGALYVTDTRENRIYRVAGPHATIAVQDTVLRRPNGIIWDPGRGQFVIGSLSGTDLLGWRPGQPSVEKIAPTPRGVIDGVEVIGPDRLLITSQADSSVQIVTGGAGRTLFKVDGRPADHALDTRRFRVALPFMATNRVEIWQLGRVNGE